LDNFLSTLDQSDYKEVKELQYVRQDIVKSKNVCKPLVFEQEGKAFMYKK